MISKVMQFCLKFDVFFLHKFAFPLNTTPQMVMDGSKDLFFFKKIDNFK